MLLLHSEDGGSPDGCADGTLHLPLSSCPHGLSAECWQPASLLEYAVMCDFFWTGYKNQKQKQRQTISGVWAVTTVWLDAWVVCVCNFHSSHEDVLDTVLRDKCRYLQKTCLSSPRIRWIHLFTIWLIFPSQKQLDTRLFKLFLLVPRLVLY